MERLINYMNHKTAKRTAQQGDVLLKKLDAMPEGNQTSVSRKRLVLARGESGHSHVIEDDEAELIQIGERMLLKLTRSATVVHEEHKPIRLSPGIWDIGRVREFDPFESIARQVVD
jgi:hypothetical protein